MGALECIFVTYVHNHHPNEHPMYTKKANQARKRLMSGAAHVQRETSYHIVSLLACLVCTIMLRGSFSARGMGVGGVNQTTERWSKNTHSKVGKERVGVRQGYTWDMAHPQVAAVSLYWCEREASWVASNGPGTGGGDD